MRSLARACVTLLLLAPLVASCGEPEKAPPAAPPSEATVPPAADPAPTRPASAPAPAPTPEATPSAEKPSDATPRESAAPAPTVPAREVPPPQDPASAPTATPAPPAPTPEVEPEPAPPPAPPPATPPSESEASAVELPKRPEPAGKVTLPAKQGAVTFDHGKHVAELKIDCATCHHESRKEKPLVAQQQSCRECHTQPAAAPMTTSLRNAVHDTKATAGLCVDCHRDPENQGRETPVKCADCHRKTAT